MPFHRLPASPHAFLRFQGSLQATFLRRKKQKDKSNSVYTVWLSARVSRPLWNASNSGGVDADIYKTAPSKNTPRGRTCLLCSHTSSSDVPCMTIHVSYV